MEEQKEIVELSYNPADKLLTASWTIDFNDSITEDDIKEGFERYLNVLKENHVKAVIMDFFRVRYPITEDLYQWAIEQLVEPTYRQGVVLFAYVAPDDPISRFGFEMYIQELVQSLKKNEQEGGVVKRNIFQTRSQAEQWIRDRLSLLSDN